MQPLYEKQDNMATFIVDFNKRVYGNVIDRWRCSAFENGWNFGLRHNAVFRGLGADGQDGFSGILLYKTIGNLIPQTGLRPDFGNQIGRAGFMTFSKSG